MKLVAFEPGHTSGIELARRDQLGLGGEASSLAGVYSKLGPAFSLLAGERIIACGGVALQPGRVGHAWLLPGQQIADHGVGVARLARSRLPAVVREHGLLRLQTTLHVDHTQGRRWLRFLGFRCEGVMRRFFDGQDYYLYARI